MKNICQNVILIMLLFFTTISCKESYKCRKMPEQTMVMGEIMQNAMIVDLGYRTKPKEGQIITSDSLNIFDLVVSFDNGETKNPIDFSKYTVLGKFADGGCRAIVALQDVTKYTELKKYIYRIKVISCGKCTSYWQEMNWVLIPKIEDDFSVEFVVENEQR